MKKVMEVDSHPLFMEEVPEFDISLGAETYGPRMKLLAGRVAGLGLTHVVIYGDREHFANLEYFCGYDCRFEEALLVVDAGGAATLLVGNEGVSQTYAVTVPVQVLLYQNFSLPGQPRNQHVPLAALLGKCGIGADSRVGLAGYKYFEPAYTVGDADQTYDLPAYIVDEVRAAAGSITNFTKEIIGIPDGLRMRVRTAREIAWIENAGNRTAGVVQRMFKALKPGLSEIEIGRRGRIGFEPQTVFSMINFGAEHVRVGVRSPDFRTLRLGEVATLCYGSRGNLTSRVSVAGYDERSVDPAVQPHLQFYQDHWLAVTRWVEAVRVGATAGELYDAVMDVIGDEKYGVALNPSHYTGTDEWANASTRKGATEPLLDGVHIQVDIIASRQDPVMTSICEDCVVIAGDGLQQALAKEYPEVYARIRRRQQAIREVLGIAMGDEVLPMSNLNFVQYPYMLNLGRVFALK